MKVMTDLDRSDWVPLHLQLKNLLASRIADGSFRSGSRFPSEREIQRQYGVSRTTVREALRALIREGLIETIPGRGTFVTRRRPDLTVKVSLSGFTADIRRQNMTPSSILLDARLIPSPSTELLEVLHIPPNTEVVKLERLRLVNNVPLALHTVYLPHHLCPQLLQHNLAQESLFTLLRDHYGLKLARAEERVCAALANQREMELLKLTYPAAVLRAERTTYLDTGEVIEFAQAIYCGEWYKLSLELEPIESGSSVQ